jgi:hypothetical protein
MMDAFSDRGYAVLPRVVPGSTVRALRAEADRLRDSLIATMCERQATDRRVTWWRLANGMPYLFKIKPVLDLCPTASAIAGGPLRKMASEALQLPPLLMEDKLMFKEQLNIEASWAELAVLGEEVCKHTDASYFRQRGYGGVITVAVCLDDCPPEAGALKVWPGSHRRDIAMAVTERQGPIVPDLDAPDSEAVLLTASAGSVLVWDSSLVHASDPNVSGQPRRLLVLGYAAQKDDGS